MVLAIPSLSNAPLRIGQIELSLSQFFIELIPGQHSTALPSWPSSSDTLSCNGAAWPVVSHRDLVIYAQLAVYIRFRVLIAFASSLSACESD